LRVSAFGNAQLRDAVCLRGRAATVLPPPLCCSRRIDWTTVIRSTRLALPHDGESET
jgi:hypothetical protein